MIQAGVEIMRIRKTHLVPHHAGRPGKEKSRECGMPTMSMKAGNSVVSSALGDVALLTGPCAHAFHAQSAPVLAREAFSYILLEVFFPVTRNG